MPELFIFATETSLGYSDARELHYLNNLDHGVTKGIVVHVMRGELEELMADKNKLKKFITNKLKEVYG